MTPAPSPSLAGRTVLVTGATTGIGKATALGLAAMGAQLAISGRDNRRTEKAARELRAVGGGLVEIFVADLSKQSEVRRLAQKVLQQLPRIDVLVNNAGGSWDNRHVTADGLECTFAVNHLAPFLLTRLLLDRLKRSAPARVVTVSSQAHGLGRIDFDDLQGQGRDPPRKATTTPSPHTVAGQCRPRRPDQSTHTAAAPRLITPTR